MMQNEVERKDDVWGLCPVCGNQPDHFLNVGRNHYFVCHRDRTYWWVGSNLFSAWVHEDPAIWERNAQTLATYRKVDAAYSPRVDTIHDPHRDARVKWFLQEFPGLGDYYTEAAIAEKTRGIVGPWCPKGEDFPFCDA